jgi:hypothetical protein
MSLAKKVGKACMGLAAGGMCLNPCLAQQGNSGAAPASKGAQAVSPQKTADKEVTLAPDGSFRAAVLTRAGYLVPGANVTISCRQKEAADPMKSITGTRGLTTVSGLKPGMYQVRVESPQGTYEGALLVKSAPVANVSFVPPPLVTFMLVPAHPPDQECERERKCGAPALEELEEGELGGGLGGGLGGALGGGLLLPLALVGGAAAIAIPLSVGRQHRASP